MIASAMDTISVPLTAADFDLIDRALSAYEAEFASSADADALAELRDRLKRSRLLP